MVVAVVVVMVVVVVKAFFCDTLGNNIDSMQFISTKFIITTTSNEAILCKLRSGSLFLIFVDLLTFLLHLLHFFL